MNYYNGFNVIGYADDLVIIINGKFDSTLSDRMNVGLSLNINPEKTEIVPSTEIAETDSYEVKGNGARSHKQS